jgi:hypothetical protein
MTEPATKEQRKQWIEDGFTSESAIQMLLAMDARIEQDEETIERLARADASNLSSNLWLCDKIEGFKIAHRWLKRKVAQQQLEIEKLREAIEIVLAADVVNEFTAGKLLAALNWKKGGFA